MNKKISILSCMLFSLVCRLNAADKADNFLEVAQKATPEYYNLYFAAKFGPAEQQALLAIYAPTDDEPSMKSASSYYDLFKVKMGFIDDLNDAPSVDVKPFRGSGTEILFRNKILYLPGGRLSCTPYSYIPLDPNDEGPILFDISRDAHRELLFTKFALTILYR